MVEVEVEVEEATTGGDDETKRESETPLASLSDWELADDELSFAVEELSEDDEDDIAQRVRRLMVRTKNVYWQLISLVSVIRKHT